VLRFSNLIPKSTKILGYTGFRKLQPTTQPKINLILKSFNFH